MAKHCPEVSCTTGINSLGGRSRTIHQRLTDANCFSQSVGRSLGIGYQFGSQSGRCFCRTYFGEHRRRGVKQHGLLWRNGIDYFGYHWGFCGYGHHRIRITKSKRKRYVAHYRCDDWLRGQCHYRRIEILQCGGRYTGLCYLGTGQFLARIG